MYGTARPPGGSRTSPGVAARMTTPRANVTRHRAATVTRMVAEPTGQGRCHATLGAAPAAVLASGSGRDELVAHRFAQQRPGDHELLDLARALVDLGDLRVAVVALGGELLGVAVAAEDLDRLTCLAARDGGCEELRLRALDAVRPPRLLQAGGA